MPQKNQSCTSVPDCSRIVCPCVSTFTNEISSDSTGNSSTYVTAQKHVVVFEDGPRGPDCMLCGPRRVKSPSRGKHAYPCGPRHPGTYGHDLRRGIFAREGYEPEKYTRGSNLYIINSEC